MYYHMSRDSRNTLIHAIFMRNRGNRTQYDEFKFEEESFEFDCEGDLLPACIHSDTPLFIFRHDATKIIEAGKSSDDKIEWIEAAVYFSNDRKDERVYILHTPEIDALDYELSLFREIKLTILGRIIRKSVLTVPVINGGKAGNRTIFRQVGILSNLIVGQYVIHDIQVLPLSGCRMEEVMVS